MSKPTLAENLAGLVDLAHNNGVDVRPTLLRVLTDLFVQKTRHTAEEERHYTELALRLIDVVDVPTRAVVAAKLAPHPAAPRSVIRRLARDILAVATPVLRQSPVLSQADLHTIAIEFGRGYAAVIATREVGAQEEAVIETAPSTPRPNGALKPGAGTSAKELNDLFYFASSEERRLILLNLHYAAAARDLQRKTASAVVIDRLEMAALARLPEQFAAELVALLGITSAQAMRIVRDVSGEPVVVAAKALGMPAPVMQRILLFLNPAVGESVKRVFDLALLFDEITREAAEFMVSVWSELAQAARPAVHRPVHYDDEAGRALPLSAIAIPVSLPQQPLVARRSA